MSAYLVHSDTIDYLLTAARLYQVSLPAVPGYGMLDPQNSADASRIGRILWRENALSVAYRYREDPAETGSYKFKPVSPTDVSAVAVLKSVANVRYQSCEHPSWDAVNNPAPYILNKIEHYAINALPGYENAPWGWERKAA